MFANLIKHKMLDQNLKMLDVAERIGASPQNLSQKMKRDNFSEKEMQEIAAALGLKLSISLEE